jgi:hypothetical protein
MNRLIPSREADRAEVHEAVAVAAGSVTRPRVPTREQQAAWGRLAARMAHGWEIGAGPIDRDNLHER